MWWNELQTCHKLCTLLRGMVVVEGMFCRRNHALHEDAIANIAVTKYYSA